MRLLNVTLLLGAIALGTMHGQPHPRLTIQRQRVVQSCGAVLDAADAGGSFLLSGIVGLTAIGATRSPIQSQALLGFWVPIPIILSTPNDFTPVVAGDRTWTWPNPFRENVHIEVQLLGSTTAEADIFDNIGQHVASVPMEALHDDVATFTWNGLIKSGSPSATGTYTVRINVTEPLRQRRLMYSTTITRIR